MMKFILQAILVCLFLSCKSPRPKTLSEILAGGCFWDITGEKQVIGGLNSCYRFLPDKSCFFYYYRFYNKRITDTVYRYYDGDNIVPDKWYAKGDTLLVARNTHYKVLTFDTVSVTVEGYKKDTMVFRKNCNTLIGK